MHVFVQFQIDLFVETQEEVQRSYSLKNFLLRYIAIAPDNDETMKNEYQF